VGPRAGLDAVARRKIPAPAGNRPPDVQTTLIELYIHARARADISLLTTND
jgi:hypothetical protein